MAGRPSRTQPGRQVPATASALPPYIRQTPDWKYWEYVPFRRNAPSRRPPCARRRDSKESRIRDSRPASSSKCLNAARAAAPKPMIPGTFSVPDLKPYSCPPRTAKGKKEPPLSCTDIQSLWGHGICVRIRKHNPLPFHANPREFFRRTALYPNARELHVSRRRNTKPPHPAMRLSHYWPRQKKRRTRPLRTWTPIFPEPLALPCPRGRHSRCPGPGPSSRRRHGPWTKTPIPPSRSPAIWRKAILDASVPPEVNTISEGNAPNRAATAARASSTASRTLLAQP